MLFLCFFLFILLIIISSYAVVLSVKNNQQVDFFSAINSCFNTKYEKICLIDLKAKSFFIFDHDFNPIYKNQLNWEKVVALETQIHPDDCLAVQKEFSKNRAKDIPFFTSEFRLINADGDCQWVQLKCHSISNSPTKMIGVICNIDAYRTLKKTYIDHEKVDIVDSELAASNELLDDLIETIADYQEQLVVYKQNSDKADALPELTHELNTPIGVCVTAVSSIQDVTEQIEQKLSDNQLSKRDFADYIKQAKNTQTLINSNITRASELIGSFQRISVAQQNKQIKYFNLNELIKDTVNTLGPRLKKTRIDIINDVSSGIDLNSLPGAFSQVIINIIMNSVTHGFNENTAGKIKLTVLSFASNENDILFTISDNGIGFKTEDAEKVFETFYSTHSSSDNSGLGLAICKKIVEQQLKGKIICNSALGSGTEFYIRLPRDIKMGFA